jgi:hypothetical protein
LAGSNCGYHAILNENSPIWDELQIAKIFPTLGRAGEGEELFGRVDYHMIY